MSERLPGVRYREGGSGRTDSVGNVAERTAPFVALERVGGRCANSPSRARLLVRGTEMTNASPRPRRGFWTCLEPGSWQLDRTPELSADGRGLRLEFDREHGWCLWGELFSVFPAGAGYGWSLDEAMRKAEAWAAGWGWRRIRTRTRRTVRR